MEPRPGRGAAFLQVADTPAMAVTCFAVSKPHTLTLDAGVAAATPAATSAAARTATVRTRPPIVAGVSLDLFQPCVLEHQPLLGAVLEADRHDPVGLDARDDSGAERCAPDRVTGRERRDLDGAGPLGDSCTVVRPRCRPQPLALHTLLGKLVEEPRRQVRVASPVERAPGRVQHRQSLLRPGHPDVAEPALLL